MKYYLSLVLFFLFISSSSFAQCGFKPLGPDDFKQGSFDYTAYITMAMGPDNLPYALFPDGGASQKLTLRRYNGTVWEDVGPRGFTSVAISDYASMAIATNGTVYAAFPDPSAGSELTVQKYNGTAWSYVGTQGFSSNFVRTVSIAVDASGTPYVAYTDLSYTNIVQKFNGTAWITLSNTGFQSTSTTSSQILIDGTGAPCVVYQDNNNSGKATAVRFDGTQWNRMGSSFSAGNVTNLNFKMDLNGNFYVSYSDYANSKILVVQKFNGTSWSTVGSAGFPNQQVIEHSLLVDKNGIPYVAFCDINLNNSISVMKFDGSNWIYFDSPGVTSAVSLYPRLLIDANGKIYLGCKGDAKKLEAFYYSSGNWVRIGDVCFSYGGFDGLSMAMDTNKMPYVCFTDVDQKIGVRKYENGTWKIVGTNFSGQQLGYFNSIAINSQNVPYVAYQEPASKKIAVKKFDGSDWITVGTPEFSAGEVAYVFMAIDPFDVPYVAFADYSTSYKRLTVMKYNGTAWVTVGLPRFSYSECTYPTLFFNTTGTPYVSFADSGNGAVWRCISNTWFEMNNTSGIRIDNYKSAAIDKNNNIYWAYVDYDGLIKLRKYNGTGTSWSNLTPSTFSSSINSGQGLVTMTTDDAGVPYIAYLSDRTKKANLVKYASNTWTAISSSFTASEVDYLAIGMGTNSTPVVAFHSYGLFARGYACDVVTDIDQPTEQVQNNGLWAYPNPTNGITTLDLKSNASVVVANSMGQVLLNQPFTEGKHQIDLSSYPAGIYIIKISDQENSKSIQLMKQN